MSILDLNIPRFADRAACRNEDPEVFFPAEGSMAYRHAKAVCKTCPVVTECLTFCLEFEANHPGSRWGVYGGTTPKQRAAMTRGKCRDAS